MLKLKTINCIVDCHQTSIENKLQIQLNFSLNIKIFKYLFKKCD